MEPLVPTGPYITLSQSVLIDETTIAAALRSRHTRDERFLFVMGTYAGVLSRHNQGRVWVLQLYSGTRDIKSLQLLLLRFTSKPIQIYAGVPPQNCLESDTSTTSVHYSRLPPWLIWWQCKPQVPVQVLGHCGPKWKESPSS
jgi:hypothetical protein